MCQGTKVSHQLLHVEVMSAKVISAREAFGIHEHNSILQISSSIEPRSPCLSSPPACFSPLCAVAVISSSSSSSSSIHSATEDQADEIDDILLRVHTCTSEFQKQQQQQRKHYYY